ncbi:MAG: glycolate oxidase subunit GlcF [Bauldia sp.]
MQTSFSIHALADPDLKEAERIIHSCVHCGFCTATCPTYVLLGDELDSPRGRIYLMKEMLEKEKPATKEVVTHIDRCLSCLACMTTCPSGVHYMHLVDHARAHVEATYTRSPWQRFLRTLLARVLPYRERFAVALELGRLGKPFAPLMGGPFAPFRAMLGLLPPRRSAAGEANLRRLDPVRPGKVRRVGMLEGCAQPVLRPEINAAAKRLLARNGIEVVPVGEDDGCCGALVHHMGRHAEALDYAKKAVDRWTRLIEKDGIEAIVITTSGCGTTLKDYGFMLRADPDYAAKAARVSAMAKDVSEFLEGLDLGRPVAGSGLAVAYHAACSLQHGQQVKQAPKALLARAGFAVREIPEGHLCCGSAGTYNILQSELAERLRDRKLANIASVQPQLVATGNIGCIAQLTAGAGVPVVHTVELLDWAYGGPKPAEMA